MVSLPLRRLFSPSSAGTRLSLGPLSRKYANSILILPPLMLYYPHTEAGF